MECCLTLHLTAAIPLALAGALVMTSPSPGSHRAGLHGHRPVPARAADSIYALAVDSNAYKEYPFVYLLDQGTVRIDANGHTTRTYRQVIQILKPAGVARWAEQSISYQPDREVATVNWMRVVRPSGDVISEKPTLSQTSDVAASIVNPVYTQTKVVRYSLSNVAPGTLVDLSWTIETTNPPLAGDLLSGWSTSLATPGLRSDFVLDVPDTLTPHIVEHHLDFARAESHRDGRHIYTWARQNVTPPKGEMFAPDSSVPVMSLEVGAPLTWSAIGRWYNGLARDRYTLTPALVAEVDSIVRSSRTGDDSLRALHEWIANDLRYVSVSLGIGGYQPRFPDSTVGTGYGDCKDKATLFIAAARHFGFTAYPVLLNSGGSTDRQLPAIEQFDHVIAAVERKGQTGYRYLDLTTFAFPDGQIPPSYQGGFGLVVHPDGTSQEITFPRDSAGTTELLFVGELTPDGKVSGTLSYTGHGSTGEEIRRSFSEPPDSAAMAALKHGAPMPFPGATVDSVILFDRANHTVDPAITYTEHGGDGAKPAGALHILTIPAMFRGAGPAFNSLVDELQRAGPRKLPIDDAEIITTGGSKEEVRLTLPAGWTAQLPTSLNAVGPFGSYRADYTQVGRELRIVHTITRGTGVYPPTMIGQLIDWFKAMTKDDAEFVALAGG
jgi:hypothetical protein